MTNTPPAAASKATSAHGRVVREAAGRTDRPESHILLHEALRALEARVEAVAREATADPALDAAPESVPPAGRMTVRLLALPAESGPVADPPFSPDDPLPPPLPPLAPVFLVAADHADHHAATACVGAVLASFAEYPLMPCREPQGFLRVDRVDLDLADALALRNGAGPATAPFALLRVRGVSLPGPYRPERVTRDPENPGEILDVKGQLAETLRRGLDHFAFHPNEADTWVAVRGMALSVLRDFWHEGDLPWPPTTIYTVRCGLPDTMTPDDILNGRLILFCDIWDPVKNLGLVHYSEFSISFELQMQS